MKAVLMAAGLGSRVSKDIQYVPKSTVAIGSQSLIEYTVNELQKNQITEIAVVTGYKADVIKAILADQPVQLLYNPFYAITNSIASLWFAKEFISTDDDYLFMNADVFMEEKVLAELLQSNLDPVMLADGTRKAEGDYKFAYQNQLLLAHGKELPVDMISGEYVGIAKVGKEFMPLFRQRLNELMEQQQYHLWWENVLYSFLGEREIYVQEITAGLFWAEVDTLPDYQRILQYAKNLTTA